MAHSRITARSSYWWLSPFLALGVLVLGVAVPGCARWNWRGDGYHDDDVNDAAKLRPSTGGQKAGFDNRAREIESDLGIR